MVIDSCGTMLLKMEIDRMIVSDLAELGLISRTLADRRLCGEYMSEVRASTTQTINKFVTALDIEPDFGVSIGAALAESGSMTKAVLTNVMVEDFGIDVRATPITPLILAVHLLHTSSLIKDVPQQYSATLRRDRPAFHISHGETDAQLTSDLLAFSAIGNLGLLKEAWGSEKTLAVTQFVTQQVACLVRGRRRDLLENIGAQTKDLVETAKLKTGSVFAMSIVPPAILAGANPDKTKDALLFAEHFGIAYQILNDLNYASKKDNPQKDTELDEENGKITFIESTGSEQNAWNLMQDHANTAKDHSYQLPGNEVRRNHIINYILDRKD